MEQFTTANRIIGEIQETLFPKLESCRDEGNAKTIESAIDDRMKQIEATLERLEIQVNKATPAQRSSLKFKLDQLRYDHKHLHSAFRTINQRRLIREREQKNREELLTRRFTTNEASRNEFDTQINIGHQEYYDNEKTKLNGFHRSIDDIIATGGAALNSLRDQGSRLQEARTKIFEIGNTLGLSNSVMRLIEKRATSDRFILFGGMFIFTIFMFLILKYMT
ncbi:Golgi SNAP receptor complex member 2 [Blomia tropicalis]|nr:Golgi SNAP receptor complex member 2 [Blomia tropicalis]